MEPKVLSLSSSYTPLGADNMFEPSLTLHFSKFVYSELSSLKRRENGHETNTFSVCVHLPCKLGSSRKNFTTLGVKFI